MQDIKQQFYETVDTHNPTHLRLIKDLLIADWWIEKINLAVEQEKERVLELLKNYFDEVKNIEVGTNEDKSKELATISYCIGLLKL